MATAPWYRGEIKWPDFGFEFSGLDSKEKDNLRALLSLDQTHSFDRFFVFRSNQTQITVWLPIGGKDYHNHPLAEEEIPKLAALLPHVFRIDASLALPASVPLAWLANEGGDSNPLWLRQERSRVLSFLRTNLGFFQNPQTMQSHAPAIVQAIEPLGRTGDKTREYELARKLIFDVAKIDAQSLADLHLALQEGNDGLANGIIRAMNRALANALNFPRWWVQDKDFELCLSAREDDLVFTIRDRTQTDYSFSERSSGLKYFLSYYIQYLAHRPVPDRSELLLMDEPDAFLSNQGQQDLLKIFNAFADPPDAARAGVQVVYVTHSPFLIDKNHAERVRVLEKGIGDEGTRVVKNASHNHYEPLRSALGAFVGESAFIGHCNLFVEGLSDQILIAGSVALLRSRQLAGEALDLNTLTIVPAGSASHVPYLVYLATGRDAEKPAVLVLLDSDKQGKKARNSVDAFGPKRRPLLPPQRILQIGDLKSDLDGVGQQQSPLLEIEDLVPPALVAEAARSYLEKVAAADKTTLANLDEAAIAKGLASGLSMTDALAETLKVPPCDGLVVDKVGLAREIIERANDPVCQSNPSLSDAIDLFVLRMRVLLNRLRTMQRDAERALSAERISQRVARSTASFLRDHPNAATREEGLLLAEEIERNLDDSAEADAVRTALQHLRRRFALSQEPSQPVAPYSDFLQDGQDQIRQRARASR